MRDRNICKFTSPSISYTFSVKCFVMETDARNLSRETVLAKNRMILAVSGEGDIIVNGKKERFSAGSVMFGFKGERFAIEAGDQLSLMYIDFEGDRGEELLRRFEISPQNFLFDGFDGLIPLWMESLSHASERTVDLAAESMILYTFSRMNRYVPERNALIDRIIEITEESFTDPYLSIAAIAEELSYNPKYISHVFKEKMGISYSEYLRSVRIKYAVSLFDHGIDSVKNVALLSGFTDPLYFSTVFKKNTGISPKEYKSVSDKRKQAQTIT